MATATLATQTDAEFEAARTAAWQDAISKRVEVGDPADSKTFTGRKSKSERNSDEDRVPDAIRFAVPRGWAFLARLHEPFAILIFRPLHQRQAGKIACEGGLCKGQARLRLGEIIKGLGSERVRMLGWYCSPDCAVTRTTYRDNRPDTSSYPKTQTRYVRGSSVGFGAPRHWGGKSSRRSNIVSRSLG